MSQLAASLRVGRSWRSLPTRMPSMSLITKRLMCQPIRVEVRNQADAVDALRRCHRASMRERDAILAAVIAWIEDRERTVQDIELGAARLLLQAAQELGSRR